MPEPKTPPTPPATPPDKPQPKQPIGDPPNKDKPRVVHRIAATTQMILEPGVHGRSTGSAHTEPLVKDSPSQDRVGPGTYGNDQFAAEHHDDFVQDHDLPEGLQDAQQQSRRSTTRPTLKAKEDRYGRIGGEGKG